MMYGAVGHLDVAQLVLYAFFLFFAGLLWYLRQEDRREGYPLEQEDASGFKPRAWLFIPSPKTFLLADGSKITVPNFEGDKRPLKARKADLWPGAPLDPTGDPLLAGVGPGSWAVRPDFPYQTFDGHDVIAPLRVATNFAVAAEGRNPLGYTVVGNDNERAGQIKDVWVDRAESILRYYEIALDDGRSVLAPVYFADVDGSARKVTVAALSAKQLAKVPTLKDPDRVTMQEEEKVAAFYGGGTLYSNPLRAEPLI